MDAASRFSEVNLIADPLYGYIEITKGTAGEPGERDLLDSPWLQRLRRIHQLQSAWWVFPSAEHSRFVHLLGAMHLCSQFARRIDGSLRAAFPDAPSPTCVEETLRLAGLLHDVGHGPFGHFFDQEVLVRWDIDHEDVGRYIITEHLADLIRSLRASPGGRFAAGEWVDPQWVAWVMADADIPGYTPPGWLRACKPILCGPATADNLDYVPRDAYMCGVSLGPVDIQRLIHYSFISDETLVLHYHAAGALEMFLSSRLYMYTQVYHHRTGRRFDLSMREIFASTVDLLLPGNPMEHPDQYRRLSDWSLLDAVQRWQDCPPGSHERQLSHGWARIMARDLTWHLAYENIVHRGTDLSQARERIVDGLPAAARGARIEVDIVSATVAPHNPMAENGMVALYDPRQSTVEHTRTRELVARLPQYNRLVRVFTDDVTVVGALYQAARKALA
ncbi:MAG: HD domain-containing protein [Candidatus Dormibacteria bacterium]